MLHNNAGILGQVAPVWEATLEGYDRVLRLNARTPFLFLREFARDRVVGGLPGSVVNTSSAAGMVGRAGLAAYSVSKQGLLGLTRTAAVELGPHGVRVNAVCPGHVNTDMGQAFDASRAQRPAAAQPVFSRPIARGRSGRGRKPRRLAPER